MCESCWRRKLCVHLWLYNTGMAAYLRNVEAAYGYGQCGTWGWSMPQMHPGTCCANAIGAWLCYKKVEVPLVEPRTSRPCCK